MTSYSKLVGNVFITKSLPAIEQVHFSKHKLKTGSFNEKINTLSKDELNKSFVASPFRNDGLLSFEWSFEGNSKNGGHTVTIKLLETTKLLEMFLLENDPLARMINSKLKHSSKFKGDLMVEGHSKLEFKDKKALMNRYYMSFGNSDEIDEFSGPYTMDLVAATLSNDKYNNRIIEVVFVPDESSFKSWSSRFGSQFGYKSDFAPTSQFVTNQLYHTCKAKERIDMNAPGKTGEELYDFNFRVRSLLKKYIGAFTLKPSQAVVAIPQDFGKATVKPESQLERGVRFKTGFGGLQDSRDLEDLGLKIAYTNDFQYSRESKDVNDYLIENGFGKDPLPAEEVFNAANIKTADQQGFSRSFIDTRVSAYEATVEREYNDTIETLTQNLEAGTRLVEEQYGAESELANTLSVEELRNRYFVSGFIPLGTPDSAVGVVVQEALAERRDFLVAAPTEVFNRKSAEAEAKREDALNGAGRQSFDQDLRQSIFDHDPPSLNRSPFAKSLPGPISKNVSTNNPSLLGYKGSVDEIKQKAFPEPDLFKKYNVLNEINVAGKWDLITDSIQALTDVRNKTFNLVMESRNEPPQDTYDGYSPLVAPLIKFTNGLKTVFKSRGVNAGRYDFYEESDMRILKLWEKYGLIASRHVPAYVYGDMDLIKSLLYLEDGDVPDHLIDTVFSLNSFDDDGGTDDRDLSVPEAGSSDFFLSRNPRVLGREKYQQYRKEFRKAFSMDRSPIVLRHNLQNSNVISLKYNVDNYYAALQNMPVRPLLDEQVVGSTRKKIIKDEASKLLGGSEGSVAEALSEFKNTPDLLSFITEASKTSESTIKLALAVADADLDAAVKTQLDLFSIMFLYMKSDSLPDLESSNNYDTLPDNLAHYQETIVRETARLLVSCKARTVPQFNKKCFLFRKVGLVGQTGGLIGAPEEIKMPAPYNGTYTAVGFKHVITPTDMYSEFDLVRGAGSEDVPVSMPVRNFLCAALTPIVQSLEDEETEFKKTQLAANLRGGRAEIDARDALEIQMIGKVGQGFRERQDKKFESTYGKPIKRLLEIYEKLGCGSK
tara:strand:- start:8573 stop:11734 length:3162 start_codon:yes stop_codon:yes gene_type:complete